MSRNVYGPPVALAIQVWDLKKKKKKEKSRGTSIHAKLEEDYKRVQQRN